MSTGPTSSLRLEKQTGGTNLNTWGDTHLNDVLDRIDTAIAGWTTKALTGNVTLTSVNYAADEARAATLKFTGTGAYTVTIPSVTKTYTVWNALSGILTITTGGSTNAVLQPGEIVTVICDNANVKKELITDFAGSVLTSVATPVNSTDAANRAYVDLQAWNVSSAVLPGQVGNSGKFLTTNGTTPSWAQVYPTQTANSGKFLTTDGTNTSWGVVTSIGDVVYSTYSRSAPTWLLADGSIYLKSSYSALDAVLSDPYLTVSTAAGGALPSVGTWLAVYGGSTFVAAHTSTAFAGATSPNGTTWTSQTTPAGGAQSLAYNNTLFMLTNTTSVTSIYTSTDGVTWNSRTVPNAIWKGTAYGNSVYVAVSNSTSGATSTDGITWTTRTFNSDYDGVLFGNGLFLAFGGSGNWATSTDGITWTDAIKPRVLQGSTYRAAFGNGYFVVGTTTIGDPLAYSTDGVTWNYTRTPAATLQRLVFSNSYFILADSTYIYLSPSPWGWQGPWAPANIATTSMLAYGGGIVVTNNSSATTKSTVTASATYLKTPVAAPQAGVKAYVKAQ